MIAAATKNHQSSGFASGIEPKKFALYVAMASMSMFFAVLTSALLVKKGDAANWVQFSLPYPFYISTLIVMGCSAVLYYTKNLYVHGKMGAYRKLLLISMVLGGLFLTFQSWGFQIMTTKLGMPLRGGNASGGFIYFIAGAHGLHILGGIVALIIVYIQAYRSRKDPVLDLQPVIHPKRKLGLDMVVAYWHFVDLLWIYLFIFFFFNY